MRGSSPCEVSPPNRFIANSCAHFFSSAPGVFAPPKLRVATRPWTVRLRYRAMAPGTLCLAALWQETSASIASDRGRIGVTKVKSQGFALSRLCGFTHIEQVLIRRHGSQLTSICSTRLRNLFDRNCDQKTMPVTEAPPKYGWPDCATIAKRATILKPSFSIQC